MDEKPFWKTKKLNEKTTEEWESLCDGCARCCLIRFQDEDTEEILQTNVACRFLDIYHCRCTRYVERLELVPNCIALTVENIPQLSWLPATCAYRLVSEGKDLPDWHPLVVGNGRALHRSGISVRAKVISEADIDPDDIEDYIME